MHRPADRRDERGAFTHDPWLAGGTRRGFLQACGRLLAGLAVADAVSCSRRSPTSPVDAVSTPAQATPQPAGARGSVPTLSPTGGDDTLLIVNALRDAADGGTIWLAAGATFRCTGTIVVPAGKTLAGEPGGELPTIATTTGGGTGVRGFVNLANGSALQRVHLVGPGATAPLTRRPGVNSGVCSDWKVDGCTIEQFNGAGVNFGDDCGNVAITGNDIHDNGDAGVQIGQRCSGCRVAGNRVWRNACNGIDCNGSSNVIENNECWLNGWKDPKSADRNGILIWAPDGGYANLNQVRGNSCHDNYRNGIVVTAGAAPVDGNVVTQNVCERNACAGILVEGLAGLNTRTSVQGNRANYNGRSSQVPNETVGYGFKQGDGIYARIAACTLTDNSFVGNRTSCVYASAGVAQSANACG